MKTIRELQARQLIFSVKNFGPEIDPTKMILGIVEEVGELSHAHLKNLQQIRMNEGHIANMKDAIGDTFVYMMALCNGMGFDLEEIIEDTCEAVFKRDWKKHKNNGVNA